MGPGHIEARRSEIEAALTAPQPPVRLHPNLAELYRKKVTHLAETLQDPEIRTPALEIARGLVEQVTVRMSDEGVVLELVGALAAMIDLAQPESGGRLDPSSVKVVAGARCQRQLLLETWA